MTPTERNNLNVGNLVTATMGDYTGDHGIVTGFTTLPHQTSVYAQVRWLHVSIGQSPATINQIHCLRKIAQ